MEASPSPSPISESVVDERQTELREISSFIDESTCFCQEILKKVGWTMESLEFEEKPAQVTCPVDQSHRMSSASLPHHIERCTWAEGGYTREEQLEGLRMWPHSLSITGAGCCISTRPREEESRIRASVLEKKQEIVQLAESGKQTLKNNSKEIWGESTIGGEAAGLEENNFFYENKKGEQAVILDADSQSEIIFRSTGKPGGLLPRTMDRLDAEFGPDQRLAIYEAVMERCRLNRQRDEEELDLDIDLLQETEKKDGDEKPKSHMEMLAEMRDYRRRRQSYRAKNVHITKKSKTDVMREIIEAHMRFLADTGKPEGSDGRGDRDSRERSRTRQDRDASCSREGSEHRFHSREDGKHDGHARSKEYGRSRDGRDRSASPGRHGHHSSKHKHKHKHKRKRRSQDRD